MSSENPTKANVRREYKENPQIVPRDFQKPIAEIFTPDFKTSCGIFLKGKNKYANQKEKKKVELKEKNRKINGSDWKIVGVCNSGFLLID